MPVLRLVLHVAVERVEFRQARREQGDISLVVGVGPVRLLFQFAQLLLLLLAAFVAALLALVLIFRLRSSASDCSIDRGRQIWQNAIILRSVTMSRIQPALTSKSGHW